MNQTRAMLDRRPHRPKPDDPDILAGVEDCQRRGLSHRATAAILHIATTTVTDWLTAGRTELGEYADGKLSELGSHGLFAVHFERGAGEREAVNTDAITASITDKSVSFVPALILNKARNPAEWIEARQVNMHVEGSVKHTLSLELPGSSSQELLEMVQARLQSGVPLLPAPDTESP